MALWALAGGENVDFRWRMKIWWHLEVQGGFNPSIHITDGMIFF
jgi:hypothetical protein